MSGEKPEIKVFIVGDKEVGKTQLINRLGNRPFDSSYKQSKGYNFKSVEIEGNKFFIWDTPGDERFYMDSPTFYSGAKVFLIVLDATQPLDEARQKKYIEQVPSKSEIFFVVNKIDILTRLDSTDKDNWIDPINRLMNTVRPNHGDCTQDVIFYSAKNSHGESINKDPVWLKLAAIAAIPELANIEQLVSLDDNDIESSESDHNRTPILGSTLTKLLLGLAAATFLTALFLAAGGLTGGLENIWTDIYGFFDAINLLTDWGIGVVAASIGLALTITASSMVYFFPSKPCVIFQHINGDQDNGKEFTVDDANKNRFGWTEAQSTVPETSGEASPTPGGVVRVSAQPK